MLDTRHTQEIAAILRLTRAKISLTQPERTLELLSGKDPDSIIREHMQELYAESDNTINEVARWEKMGFNALAITDAKYPTLLREVHQAPAILYWQGRLNPSEVGISIVGSRKATTSQRAAAYELAAKLAVENIPIISGLAAGIDTAAHSGALSAHGRTIAVMGTGLATTYPRENSALREQIINRGGLVITQFEPDRGPTRQSFPMRNEVMSGYGAATIVMAADEKSGTRHQVRAAVKHGRQVIFTARIADEVTWAKKLVSEDKALTARSLDEAIERSLGVIQQRQNELQLFA